MGDALGILHHCYGLMLHQTPKLRPRCWRLPGMQFKASGKSLLKSGDDFAGETRGFQLFFIIYYFVIY